MSTRATEKDTPPTPDLIAAEMAGAIYLGTFKPAAGGKVPVIDKASAEVLFDSASGNGARSGGPSIMDEYSQWQWITVNDKVPAYPF